MVEGHVGSYESPPALLFRVIVYFWMPVLVTVITMRLFAEEKRAGTIETLMTAPVSDVQVVLGKYAGALTFLLIATAPAVGQVFLLDFLSPGIDYVDPGAVAGGCLMVVSLSAFCVSIGLVVSLMTRNQIVAAICCFCGVLVPLLAGYLVSVLPLGSEALVGYVSVHSYLLDYTRGSVDTRPLIMHASGTLFLVFTAVKILESRRWKWE